ncbi:MAG: SpoIIIAH-like family protein [Oscillospiraceae bacterium]|nr:SpoIIIAH-like family protein [Oscillospiraceae bacterium]
MKVIKTTERQQQRSLVHVGESIKDFPQKVGRFFAANRKKSIVVSCAVLLIGGALFLNWTLFGNLGGVPDDDYTPASGTHDPSGTDTDGSFFAVSAIERQRSRDEAREVFQIVIDSSDAEEDARTTAIAGLSRIAEQIEAEINIETLLRARGFENSLAVVSEAGVTVIVESEDTLMANQLVQIKEVTLEQTGVNPLNINIIERQPS